MHKLFLGALTTIGLGAATAGGVVIAGVVDVGADTPHSSFTYQALAFARERAIASRIGDIKIPADIADPERVRRGAGNYAAMCVNCHLSPGATDTEIRKGLYPTPPNLSEKPTLPPSRDAARDFWIIKHGIKASGMPAWSKGGMEDDAIWDLAAFLKKMPFLSVPAYEQLLAASDGHSHGGVGGHGQEHGDHEGNTAAEMPKTPPGKSQKTGSHDHGAHKH